MAILTLTIEEQEMIVHAWLEQATEEQVAASVALAREIGARCISDGVDMGVFLFALYVALGATAQAILEKRPVMEDILLKYRFDCEKDN